MKLMDSVKKEKIHLNQKKINIYLCGPTVYDNAHLGHARSSVCFDLLRRVLIAQGCEVNFVRNYTDIDDKILKKISENGKSIEEFTEFYIQSYEDDMRKLNVLDPNLKPRATHFIQEMIDLISQLDKKGFVYTLEDGLYFDTSKDKDYLSLSNRGLDENISRLNNDIKKKNESDFVLWKFDENFYESKFGKGRPGWHTECVAMIDSIFKDTLDIHAGGIDLFFPHHENESAQCRCGCERSLAKIWLHNGFVKINGEKMSKSLNNSFFIKDALKDFMGEVLRFYLLNSHYRAHFNYSLEDLYTAKKRLDKFYRLKKRLNIDSILDFNTTQNIVFKSDIAQKILEILNDDLNISKALAFLDDFINNANLELDKKNKTLKQDIENSLNELAKIFGFGFMGVKEYFQWGVSEDKKAFIENEILKRNEAKKDKDFKKADEIRENLAKEGILLQDTPSGTIWEYENA
ncbi:cysteine--tRNA ligase [Campylobacter molothri]|uniref:cysteine--tRNA ligase n=1 Tax=Campylobacter molothri TaxID=1032242 RepID=UPI001EFAAF37|nr:cysteine--tRNA ligase [Campylobacter sp. RM10537]MBZ7949191.1 cysteine--tRNA ligase [Campylobacter sp. RM10534]ULN99763.1 cysteinyl-tRNA synthetase [Campylobacter sp. RM10537]